MPQRTFIKEKQGSSASERHWHESHRLHWSTFQWSNIANKKWYNKVLLLHNISELFLLSFFFFFSFECCFSFYNCSSSKKQARQKKLFFSHNRPRYAIHFKEQWRRKVCREDCWNRLYWTTTIFSLETFCRQHSFTAVKVTKLWRFSLLS